MDSINVVDLIVLAFLQTHSSLTDSDITSSARSLGLTSMQFKQSIVKLRSMKIIRITVIKACGTVSLTMYEFSIDKSRCTVLGLVQNKGGSKVLDTMTLNYSNDLQSLKTELTDAQKSRSLPIIINILINLLIELIDSINYINYCFYCSLPTFEQKIEVSSGSDFVEVDALISFSPVQNVITESVHPSIDKSNFILRKQIHRKYRIMTKDELEFLKWFQNRLEKDGISRASLPEFWARDQLPSLIEASRYSISFEDLKDCFEWMITDKYWGGRYAIKKISTILKAYPDFLVVKNKLGRKVKLGEGGKEVRQWFPKSESQWRVDGLEKTCGCSYEEWRKKDRELHYRKYARPGTEQE